MGERVRRRPGIPARHGEDELPVFAGDIALGVMAHGARPTPAQRGGVPDVAAGVRRPGGRRRMTRAVLDHPEEYTATVAAFLHEVDRP
ncbi:hypothetical protein [Streptomyces sennicomposti]